MYGKSPMMKKLIGKQHNLPEHLKAKIEGSPAQQRKDLPDTEDAKAETKGQGIIGMVESGKISQEEGNSRLNALQNKPQSNAAVKKYKNH